METPVVILGMPLSQAPFRHVVYEVQDEGVGQAAKVQPPKGEKSSKSDVSQFKGLLISTRRKGLPAVNVQLYCALSTSSICIAVIPFDHPVGHAEVCSSIESVLQSVLLKLIAAIKSLVFWKANI